MSRRYHPAFYAFFMSLLASFIFACVIAMTKATHVPVVEDLVRDMAEPMAIGLAFALGAVFMVTIGAPGSRSPNLTVGDLFVTAGMSLLSIFAMTFTDAPQWLAEPVRWVVMGIMALLSLIFVMGTLQEAIRSRRSTRSLSR